MSKEIDEAIERAAQDISDDYKKWFYEPSRWKLVADIIHKRLDPVLRLPDGMELPVKVWKYEADSVYAGQERKSLSINEDIAADFINRVGKEYE